MAVRQSTIRNHTDIKKEFDKLSNIREFGVRKYSMEFCINKLAQQFYKSPKTIENIVFNRTVTANISNNSQTSLFNE